MEEIMKVMRRIPSHVLMVVMALVLLAGGLSCQRAGESGLTPQEGERIASVYLEARNTPDLGLLDKIYDAEVVVHDCGAPEDIRGLDALKSYYEASHVGFPDFKAAFEDVFVSGDKIVIRWTITATHRGPLRGLPPTGKPVRFSGLAIDRVAQGKIVEEWVDFNVLDLLQQLGFTLVPPAPAGNG
jgi:steroid delta-isomerase-like uncharacterized protein